MLQHVLQALGGNKTAANCFITHAQIINTQDVDKKWIRCNNNNNNINLEWNYNKNSHNSAVL